ncbi:pyridoxamine 5'-phosphate oxidase family protein [Kocuria massiliensis]|uniref:pyridoxamine 5'-phosphate oxidase family protein n=1 Tax=Kocuria massiliensis TaxID=1926282 RepID=UPI0022B96376|nr:pyridoxamine 5'-phosphate oxidase family protein [Kocuria massiliensis]
MNLPMNIAGSDVPRDPEPRVRVLSDDECWDFLATTRFARLATVDHGEADITPLNIAVSGRRIYFRTAAGNKLTRLLLNPAVAVESDRVEGGTAVSVVVRGSAKLLADSDEIVAAESLDISPWLHTEKIEYVEITPAQVSGRKFRLGE